MGGAPNYSKGRKAMRRMSEGKSKAFAQNIIIKEGNGKYPKCFDSLPYPFCPKKEELPQDPKSVHGTCKLCQEFLKSKFYNDNFAEKAYEERLKRLKDAGLPTVIEG